MWLDPDDWSAMDGTPREIYVWKKITTYSINSLMLVVKKYNIRSQSLLANTSCLKVVDIKSKQLVLENKAMPDF